MTNVSVTHETGDGRECDLIVAFKTNLSNLVDMMSPSRMPEGSPVSATDDFGIRVVSMDEMTEATQQTPGMLRRSGIDRSASQQLWVGRVSTDPGFSSGPHHHGEAETVGHVLLGRARILYGPDFKLFVDLDPGDFIYIPPHLPHIEENLSQTEPLEFITIRSPDNIVVNLDPDS